MRQRRIAEYRRNMSVSHNKLGDLAVAAVR
jgi:hypothetical protein